MKDWPQGQPGNTLVCWSLICTQHSATQHKEGQWIQVAACPHEKDLPSWEIITWIFSNFKPNSKQESSCLPHAHLSCHLRFTVFFSAKYTIRQKSYRKKFFLRDQFLDYILFFLCPISGKATFLSLLLPTSYLQENESKINSLIPVKIHWNYFNITPRINFPWYSLTTARIPVMCSHFSFSLCPALLVAQLMLKNLSYTRIWRRNKGLALPCLS